MQNVYVSYGNEEVDLYKRMSNELRAKFCQYVAIKSAHLFMTCYTEIQFCPQWNTANSPEDRFRYCVKNMDYFVLRELMEKVMIEDFNKEKLPFLFTESFFYLYVLESISIQNHIFMYCKTKYNLDFNSIPHIGGNDVDSDGYVSA